MTATKQAAPESPSVKDYEVVKATEVRFHVQVFIAGREGVQESRMGNKRLATRECKSLVAQGGFGSAGSVTMETFRPGRNDFKRTLIFQCARRYQKNGKLVTKVEEL